MMQYRVPLPKGASEEAVNLSKEVNKWANIEMALLFQVDDLEYLESKVGTNPTFRALLREKEAAHEVAEKRYEDALHKMCEAM